MSLQKCSLRIRGQQGNGFPAARVFLAARREEEPILPPAVSTHARHYRLQMIMRSFYISKRMDRSKSAECAKFSGVTALVLCIRARLSRAVTEKRELGFSP